jgi:hypothetical protein
MNEHELLEVELRRLKPAVPPEEFMARLEELLPAATSPAKPPQPWISTTGFWWQLARWLAPVAAGVALIIAALVWLTLKPATEAGRPNLKIAAKPTLKPDNVQIDRQLVAAYDAVAQMPDGEPVRFRCQQWMDEVVLRDSARGFRIEQRTPRFEIVAAKLETY